MPNIYLDYAAGAPTLPDVWQVMADIHHGNPTAPHMLGQKAAHIVEHARRVVLQTLGLELSWNVLFTSTCTEANNLVLHSFDQRIISATEHKSVSSVTPNIAIPVDNLHGIIDISALMQELEHKPPGMNSIVSVAFCNNETGTLQPIKQIAAIAKKSPNVFMHSDMAQSFARIDLDINDSNIDMLTFSGHKIGAPSGVAVLVYHNRCTPILKPFITGGGQEYGLRSGTHNVPAIAALAFILENNLEVIQTKELTTLQNKLENGLKSICKDTIIVGSPRAPHISCVITPGLDRRMQMIFLDTHGICVGFGSSCSAGGDEPSPTLTAMGYPQHLQDCAIRISTGWDTKESDIDFLLEVWKKMLSKQY